MKHFNKIATIMTTLMLGASVATSSPAAAVLAATTDSDAPASDTSTNSNSNSVTKPDDSKDTTGTDTPDADKPADNTKPDDTSNVADTDKPKKHKAKPKQKVTGYSMMTKVAGNKNYKVWKTVSNGKVHTKVADGKIYQYNHIQSDQLIETKKARYWRIYVDGREVGYVNENYFAKNQIAVPKTISLVRNDNYDFFSSDAISYVTNSMGTVIDSSQVKISKQDISCSKAKTYKVKYSYGSAKATVKVTVRKSTSEGIVNPNDYASVTGQPGTEDYKSWKKHYGSSVNYISPTEYTPETESHTLSSNGLTLKTKFYQPVLLSVKDPSDDNINRVGHIPEGMTVSNGWAYTSLLSHTNLMSGHVVGYDLNKLKSPYNAQHLLDMSQTDFNNYVKHIKVSQYIPIGHGQAMGASNKYIYVINNDHTQKESTDSVELVQIRKSDMQINKIWTFKTWVGDDSQPRYFQNGVVMSDTDMYTVYHDAKNKCYEYWELQRKGDNWYPTLVGKTNGNFVSNGAPVQGFAYDPVNQKFYLGFNDLIFKMSRNGAIKQTYQFDTGREIEGMSVSDNQLYVNLAQRAELLVSMNIN